MPDSDPLMETLLAAVRTSPEDVPLRLHVADLLLGRGRPAEALEHCSKALGAEPANPQALDLLRRVGEAMAADAAPSPSEPGGQSPHTVPSTPPDFDWAIAEGQVEDIAIPAGLTAADADPVVEDVESSTVRLADVGGMEQVKQRLELAFLGPLRNPDVAKAYGKSLSGGLLLWGPPGCGKTFIARALAGEVGARFYAVQIADVLDMYVGRGERNIAEIFDVARRNAPSVLFFDEIDALGQKRSHLRNDSWLRTMVNTLLAEMDSVGDRNEGVFVLGATNHPWDVDSALLRPGRFERRVLVLPPDPPARETILRRRLRDRPATGLDLDRLSRMSEGFSGADLAHLVDSATELALADSLRTGEMRPIGMTDFKVALGEVKPSTGPWLQTARNVVAYANADGTYDELLAYLKRRRLM